MSNITRETRQDIETIYRLTDKLIRNGQHSALVEEANRVRGMGEISKKTQNVALAEEAMHDTLRICTTLAAIKHLSMLYNMMNTEFKKAADEAAKMGRN